VWFAEVKAVCDQGLKNVGRDIVTQADHERSSTHWDAVRRGEWVSAVILSLGPLDSLYLFL
jgi:hypothetical protein